MPPYVTAFGDGTIVLPRHDDVLQDHQALQFVDGIIRVPNNFRFKGSDGFDRHGDSAVACALAFYASRQPVTTYAYQSAHAAEDDDQDGWGDRKTERSFRRGGGLW